MSGRQKRRLSENVAAMQRRRDDNAERPINRLPAEIFSQIFEYAIDELRDTWPSEAYDDVRLVITGVCSWWRAIAIANPALWGILIYQDNDDVTLWSQRWTLLCLSRSGDSDLDVSVSVLVEKDEDEDDEGEVNSLGDEQFARILAFMNNIKSSWHRVSSAIFQVQSWDAMDAVFPLPEAGPKLRHLEIDVSGPRPSSSEDAILRIFPPILRSDLVAQHYPHIRTLKLASHRLSVSELTRIIECLPCICFLRIQNHSPEFQSIVPPTLFLTTPLLEELDLVQSYFSSTNFDAPGLQSMVYELPSTTEDECVDFFPTQLVGSKASSSPAQLMLGDVRDSPDFFEPAVRLLRSYPRLSVLRLRGKEAVGKLLGAAFGGGGLIVAPGASPFEGLQAPSSLQRIEIVGWESAELHQRHVQVPDPAELTELAEVLLELLKNSPTLLVQWWSLHDPTRIQHPDFAQLRQTCETMISQFPDRVSLKLAGAVG